MDITGRLHWYDPKPGPPLPGMGRSPGHMSGQTELGSPKHGRLHTPPPGDPLHSNPDLCLSLVNETRPSYNLKTSGKTPHSPSHLMSLIDISSQHPPDSPDHQHPPTDKYLHSAHHFKGTSREVIYEPPKLKGDYSTLRERISQSHYASSPNVADVTPAYPQSAGPTERTKRLTLNTGRQSPIALDPDTLFAEFEQNRSPGHTYTDPDSLFPKPGSPGSTPRQISQTTTVSSRSYMEKHVESPTYERHPHYAPPEPTATNRPISVTIPSSPYSTTLTHYSTTSTGSPRSPGKPVPVRGRSPGPGPPYHSPKAVGVVPEPSDQPVRAPSRQGIEAAIDQHTIEMVRNMDSGYGAAQEYNCGKCGQGIGQGRPGCTALGQTFHLECFTCSTCQMKLAGQTFYAVAGKAFCEKDYHATLDKCASCQQPITQRILRASGKPFHPECFVCSVCNKCLDNVPFTVDSGNAVHCVPCFHERYAPRCSRCTKPIIPEEGKEESLRIVAMDRSFHIDCYRCEECGMALNSKIEGRGCYPLDDHILCKTCNMNRLKAKAQ